MRHVESARLEHCSCLVSRGGASWRPWKVEDESGNEPIKAENPLLTARNCLITPHIAWAPLESRSRLMNIAVENLQAFLAGTPNNVVEA